MTVMRHFRFKTMKCVCVLTALGHAIAGENGAIERGFHPFGQGRQQGAGCIRDEAYSWM